MVGRSKLGLGENGAVGSLHGEPPVVLAQAKEDEVVRHPLSRVLRIDEANLEGDQQACRETERRCQPGLDPVHLALLIGVGVLRSDQAHDGQVEIVVPVPPDADRWLVGRCDLQHRIRELLLAIEAVLGVEAPEGDAVHW
jgi:hypothetical protein